MQIKKFSFLRGFSYQFCTGPLKTLNATKFAGKLTILPTPIGNLRDLSPNIIKALFKADVIGCQDRRVAGKLYTLIKSKNIMSEVVQDFGEIGLSSLIPFQNQQHKQRTQQEENYLYYEYANMTDKMRKKFLRKMPKDQQQKFKIDFLKYRALKILQKQDDWMKKQKQDKFDELYGIDSTDLQHIEMQIRNTRMKKGRGVLIPLNTYSQTRMFNLVKMFLQTKNVAIISDAGMPCISDPGWKMVRKIRQSLPQVPIEVIGGPSTVSLITLLASMSTNKNSLSGRFEGFAPETISQMTDRSVQIEAAKKKEFSIHFINSKKLRNKVIEMQKNYGPEQKILLANQLTKIYERKYNGTLGQLNDQMSKEENEFQGIGQLSYLVYPNKQKVQSILKIEGNQRQLRSEQKKEQIEQKPINLGRLSLISIENFIDSIKRAEEQFQNSKPKTQQSQSQQKEASNNISQNQKNKKKQPKKRSEDQASSKDLVDLICTIFGIKSSEARKVVYQKQIALKNRNVDKKPSPILEPKQVHEAEKRQQQNQSSSKQEGNNPSKRVGRRGRGGKKSQSMSAQQMQFMKMMGKQGNKFF